MNFEAGQIIDRRYRLDRFLSTRGQGEAWLAMDLHVSFPVVVKFQHPYPTKHASDLFQKEVRNLCTLKGHPFIVDILDAQETVDKTDQRPFIVFEFLPNGDLEQLVGQLETDIGRFLSIAVGVTKGLKFAHDKGIVHNDIKPSNLFLCADGRTPKVGDFGLARFVDTLMDRLPGFTERYRAPEYENPGTDRKLCDIYSLGRTFSDLLFGSVLEDFTWSSTTLDITQTQYGLAIHAALHNAYDRAFMILSTLPDWIELP